MSFQAMTWAQRQKAGNSTAKAILLVLANYADDEGSCFPGQDRLAEECECSIRTLQRQLEYLEGKGFLRRSRRVDGRGARTSDRYFLLLNDSLSHDTGDAPTRQNDGSYKDEPVRGNVSVKIEERADPIFTALRRVLDEERAQALIDHRKRIGKALTAYAAARLAERLGQCPDPNAAADEMICNGWQGFAPEWLRAERRASATRKRRGDANIARALEGKAKAGPQRITDDKVRVSSVDEYRVFRRCEDLIGRSGLQDRDGAWWFPPDLVARARREVSA